MTYLNIINFAFVLLFGIVLSLSFSDISLKNNIKQYTLIFILFGTVQVIAYFVFGDEFLFKSYPLLTHFPLFLLLKLYYRKNIYLSAISVLSAYLFCTPRKWIGTIVSFFWGYDMEVSFIVQILITIPLLFIIIKYISPYVSRLKYETNRILRFFIVVPLIYYVLEYILTVYTDLLYQGGAALVEFMDAAIFGIYFIFSIIYLKTLYEKKEVEVEQALLKILAEQSHSEIDILRQAEKQAAIHRHDLRHHINYLSTCISSDCKKEALSYINSINEELNNVKVIRYSENETLNLVLSSCIAKAKGKGIQFKINITTANSGNLSIQDLCILLSNAIENSIHACERIVEISARIINLSIYSNNNKMCIDLRNTYLLAPVIENGIPVSTAQGHGFGTKSMAYIIDKHGGVYQFSVKDRWFIFQASV